MAIDPGSLLTGFAALGQDHRNAWWTSALDNLPGRITPYLGVLLNGLFGMLFNLFIIPVFTALLLYNRGTYVAAITALVGAAWKPKLPVLLQRVVVNYARFVLGMVQVYLIVGALNTVGFLLLVGVVLYEMISIAMQAFNS